MTITTITEKAIAVTGLPEGATAWMNESYHVNTVWYKCDGMRHPKFFDLPEGNWTILGRADELTEAQKAEYEPLLKAKGLHLSNPINPPIERLQLGGDYAMRESEVAEWQSAQLISNPLILIQ